MLGKLAGHVPPVDRQPQIFQGSWLGWPLSSCCRPLASMWHWRHIPDRASLRILWPSFIEEYCRTCPHRGTRSQCRACAQPVGKSSASSRTSSDLFTGFVSHGPGRLLVATRSSATKDLSITFFPPDPGRAPGTEGRWHGRAAGDGRAGRPQRLFQFSISDQPYRVESAPARLA